MQIAERTVASFHYTLTDDAGVVIDSSQGAEPLTYLHGVGGIVPGLEKAMEGRSAGDRFDVVVAPEDGYGTPNEMLVQTVPREAFQGVDVIEDGMVTVDGNHPLAGQTLHFAIEVVDVRDASVEEVVHGHVHGAGGHHH